MRAHSVFIHKCAGRIRVDRAIAPSNTKEHQFRPVVELHAEPVPSNLIVLQLVGEELMVHPGEAGYLQGLASKYDAAVRGEPGERNIVRRASRSLSFLANAILAVDYGRLLRA